MAKTLELTSCNAPHPCPADSCIDSPMRRGMRVKTADHLSSCAGCHERITPGDRIVNPAFDKWTHVRCTRNLLGLPGDPGNGGDSDPEPDASAEEEEFRLRRGADEPADRREAATLLNVNPEAIYVPDSTVSRTPPQSRRRKAAGTRWTEEADQSLRYMVERQVSAFSIAAKLDRTQTAILARIAKVFGADSQEVALYGTWDSPGDLADWRYDDWLTVRLGPDELSHSGNIMYDPLYGYDGPDNYD